LPEKLRVAVLLVNVEGLSVTEAAEVLGITSGNLKVRVHRARQLLRARWEWAE
jgi:RNA polymerase sigma-70 factor (ECF subfamily)